MAKECCKETWNKIPEDEPVFILRGKDELALLAVAAWIEEAKRHNVSQDKIDRAIEHHKDMLRFQRSNPERCKIPD